MFISITRLRIRGWWFMPAFLWLTQRSAKQARTAAGFKGGFTLVDRKRAFWTMTGWDSEAAMKAYRGSGVHREAMKKLPDWCDEASVAHWMGDALPEWTEAWERMQKDGRFTPVNHPSVAQKEKRIEQPRTQPLVQAKI
jgi:hypothetical protein